MGAGAGAGAASRKLPRRAQTQETPGAGEPAQGPLLLARVVIRFWFGRHRLAAGHGSGALFTLPGGFRLGPPPSFGEATAAASDLAAGPVGPNVRWAARRKASFSSSDAADSKTARRLRL